MSELMNEIFDDKDINIIEDLETTESSLIVDIKEDEESKELTTDIKETSLDIKKTLKDNVGDLKNKYKVVREEATEDYDDIREEIIELKNGNHKILKDLMDMMGGNVQPQVLKSYSDIIKSTVDLNKFILDIDDKRKSNAEENIYEEMNEAEAEDDESTKPKTIYNLTPEQLFGGMMEDIKDIVEKQIKNKVIEIDDNLTDVDIL